MLEVEVVRQVRLVAMAAEEEAVLMVEVEVDSQT